MATFSYSAAARSAVSPSQAAASSSSAAAAAASGPSTKPDMSTGVNHLILDAGPLLSLAPIRHLAKSFHTTPLVLAELRDPKAREHWEHLKISGLDVRVEPPSAQAMAAVTAFAKKTGDYAVLSTTDLSVIALTYQYEVLENGTTWVRTQPGQKLPPRPRVEESNEVVATEEDAEGNDEEDDDDEEGEEVDSSDIAQDKQVEEPSESSTGAESEVVLDKVTDAVAEMSVTDTVHAETPQDAANASPESTVSVAEQVATGEIPATEAISEQSDKKEDEDDLSDGEWITPSNVNNHRSKDLGLLPEGRGKLAPLAAACMTGDYAVQNVLMGMGLGLVGEGGKRITKVRSWVLRCHACFKLCKDSSKRFCPECGNASLMRTTVSTSAVTGKQTIHLKQGFQYHLRGTKYSIPAPKMGSAKGQQKGGSGLILREDQVEWQNAVHSQNRAREKEEKRALKGEGSWMDPDWMPEIISASSTGKGRQSGHNMPAIGHGRRNPNAGKKKRR